MLSNRKTHFVAVCARGGGFEHSLTSAGYILDSACMQEYLYLSLSEYGRLWENKPLKLELKYLMPGYTNWLDLQVSYLQSLLCVC